MRRLKRRGEGVKAPSDRYSSATVETVAGERAGILNDICAGDEDLYNAMKQALFLNPSCRLSLLPAEDKLVGEAQQLQQAGNVVAARVNYEIAGKLAIHRGDAEAARRYFTSCTELSRGTSRNRIYEVLLKDIDRVMHIAKEYYSRQR